MTDSNKPSLQDWGSKVTAEELARAMDALPMLPPVPFGQVDPLYRAALKPFVEPKAK